MRWLKLTWLTAKYVVLILAHILHLSRTDVPKLTRVYLQDCGGAFVKIGQLMALRYEVLPPEFCWELSELFDNVPAMPPNLVQDIILYELGKPSYEVFTLFEEQPIASASFAQVHRAILPNGEIVAVKVQRPGLEQMLESDFRFLRVLCWFVSPFLHLKALKLSELLAETEESTMKELNYKLELENAALIRATIPLGSNIDVPIGYPELTTDHVLVQQFIEGIKLNDVMRSRRSGIPIAQFGNAEFNLDQIALDIVTELAREYFNHGIYHADPHPGNIILTQDGRIVFVDFGLVGQVSHFNRALFWEFVRHVAVEVNHEDASQAMLRLGLIPVEDKVRFLAQNNAAPLEVFDEIVDSLAESYLRPLKLIVNKWSQSISDKGATMYDRSTAVAFFTAMRLAEQYNVHFQRDIILFIRTLVISDMMAMQISPDFRIDTALKNYALRFPDQSAELCAAVGTDWIVSATSMLDPWNQDARDDAKEYLMNWFSHLVEDRPELHEHIKFSIQKFRKTLS